MYIGGNHSISHSSLIVYGVCLCVCVLRLARHYKWMRKWWRHSVSNETKPDPSNYFVLFIIIVMKHASICHWVSQRANGIGRSMFSVALLLLLFLYIYILWLLAFDFWQRLAMSCCYAWSEFYWFNIHITYIWPVLASCIGSLARTLFHSFLAITCCHFLGSFA